MSLWDVNNLPIEDAHNLWNMYVNGVIGPYKDYQLAYTNTAFIHNSTEAARAIAMGKRYKANPMPTFDKMFPEVTKWWSLGQHSDTKTRDNTLESARQAIAMSEGAPKWLRDAVQENTDASKDKDKNERIERVREESNSSGERVQREECVTSSETSVQESSTTTGISDPKPDPS